MNRIIVCICLAIFVQSVVGHFSYRFCSTGVPVPPPFADTDEIEVWFLEAPLFEEAFGRFFGKEDLYHNAIGIKDLTTKQSWTVEYDAESEVFNATVPYVYKYDNGTSDLVWLNAGGICIYNSINETFWMHNHTLMATTNGSVLNYMFNWVPQDNATWPMYQTFNVWDHWRGNMLIQPSTCAEFVWRFLAELQKIGVQLNLYQHPRHDFINLYCDSLVPVNASDPGIWDRLIKWYTHFQFDGLSFEKILAQLHDAANDQDKFVYAYGVYYSISLQLPFADFCYAEDPLDGSHNYAHADHCLPPHFLTARTLNYLSNARPASLHRTQQPVVSVPVY